MTVAQRTDLRAEPSRVMAALVPAVQQMLLVGIEDRTPDTPALALWWRAEPEIANDRLAVDFDIPGNIGDRHSFGTEGHDRFIAGKALCMSPLALFLCTHLPRLQRWAYGSRCSARCADVLEDGLLVVQEALHRLTEVLDQVKTIGNLDGLRCTARRTLDVGIAAIPADD